MGLIKKYKGSKSKIDSKLFNLIKTEKKWKSILSNPNEKV